MAKKKKDDDSDEKPKGGLLKIILGAVLLLAAGAGGAYGAFAAGLFGNEASANEPDMPKLVRKGAEDPYAFSTGDEKDQVSVVHGEGGSEHRTAYYAFEDTFTSNLFNSPALIQTDIAVSTQYDGRVLQWVNQHELAIRSALLTELAATPEDDIFSAQGKQALAERLARAVNTVLEEQEGFGGVEAVHFRGLLVQ